MMSEPSIEIPGGYTRFPNRILDNGVMRDINNKCGKMAGYVLLSLVRNSIGYDRLSAEISVQKISNEIGISLRCVRNCLLKLIEYSYIEIEQKNIGITPVYAINLSKLTPAQDAGVCLEPWHGMPGSLARDAGVTLAQDTGPPGTECLGPRHEMPKTLAQNAGPLKENFKENSKESFKESEPDQSSKLFDVWMKEREARLPDLGTDPTLRFKQEIAEKNIAKELVDTKSALPLPELIEILQFAATHHFHGPKVLRSLNYFARYKSDITADYQKSKNQSGFGSKQQFAGVTPEDSPEWKDAGGLDNSDRLKRRRQQVPNFDWDVLINALSEEAQKGDSLTMKDFNPIRKVNEARLSNGYLRLLRPVGNGDLKAADFSESLIKSISSKLLDLKFRKPGEKIELSVVDSNDWSRFNEQPTI